MRTVQAPAIIFIDEIDAIGTKRFDSELSGDREVQRTMLELLNQLDGFGSDENIKVWEGVCLPSKAVQPNDIVLLTMHVDHCFRYYYRLAGLMSLSVCQCALASGTLQVIAATNRADTLDPALMRSGRLDRKVEFPHPNEDARAKILQIHSRKMNVG